MVKTQQWRRGRDTSEREMGSHGRMKAFDGRAESWVEYAERLEQYFIANGITEAAKKRAVLLAVVGGELSPHQEPGSSNEAKREELRGIDRANEEALQPKTVSHCATL